MLRRVVNRFRKKSTNLGISEFSKRVQESKLTYLFDAKLINLESCINEISEKQIPGIFIEAGVALGGSAIIIAKLMPKNREFHGYDVFEMIPPPSDKDDDRSKERYEIIKSGKSEGIDGDTYYGYLPNLYERVIDNFEQFGLAVDNKKISLHKGLFQDTMNFETKQIAFAHIDCDWYEPVWFCLNTIYSSLSIGGFIILDDYHDYGGCKKATDLFLKLHHDLEMKADNSNVVLVRKSS
jgi:asparagine synthase (glutamine-hydrolysing)